MEVTFRDNDGMEIVELARPDGSVVALPADQVSGQTGQKFRDMYPRQYAAFKKADKPEAIEANETVPEEPRSEPANVSLGGGGTEAVTMTAGELPVVSPTEKPAGKSKEPA